MIDLELRMRLVVPHKRIALWFAWLKVKHACGFTIDIGREALRVASWCKTEVI